VSLSQIVFGISGGLNEATSYEPVNRRADPGSGSAFTAV
jgi:hypothetical protein